MGEREEKGKKISTSIYGCICAYMYTNANASVYVLVCVSGHNKTCKQKYCIKFLLKTTIH